MPSDDNQADLWTKTLRVDRLEKLRVGGGVALNMAEFVESEYAGEKLDRVDTHEDLNTCLEQLCALMNISNGEACKWPGEVTG